MINIKKYNIIFQQITVPRQQIAVLRQQITVS